MATIKIYGASDDLVEVEGCEGADEFNVYGTDTPDSEVMWRGDLIAPGGTEAMQVHAIRTGEGCWAVAIGQADESIPLPPWPVRIEQHRSIPYSTVLRIDAPYGTRLTNVWPEVNSDG
ncbi:MAG TPA: hypothetical protein VE465_13890 [Streptosporangiaceae bacterium]|jgi:hypothetical protein|nr:hypothetical protein [Streptosporangiaceae bacterium]